MLACYFMTISYKMHPSQITYKQKSQVTGFTMQMYQKLMEHISSLVTVVQQASDTDSSELVA